MQNKWLTWVFVMGVVVMVVGAVNYNSHKKDVPLSEIFPEENMGVVVNGEMPATAAEDIAAEVSQKTKEVQQATPQPVEPVKTNSAEIKPVASPAAAHAIFAIQIASFKEKAKAEKIMQQVQSKGYNAQIIAGDLGAQGTWYRVYAGSFDNKSQAAETLPSIQKDFPGSFIVSIK